MNVPGVNTLQANEFTVTLDGDAIDSIVAFDVFTYLTPDDADKPWLSVLKRVEDDRGTTFNRWLSETLAHSTPSARPRRTFVVTAVNDGNPIRRWTFSGAWIASIAQGGFQVTSHEFAVEQVAIGYDRVTCELLG